MNIQIPVAFVKADLKTLEFLQLKSYKLVEIWYNNELYKMTMVDGKNEQSIQSISNISSLSVFIKDSNGYLTIYENGKTIKKGNLTEISSIEASKSDLFIKDLTNDKFYGV